MVFIWYSKKAMHYHSTNLYYCGTFWYFFVSSVNKSIVVLPCFRHYHDGNTNVGLLLKINYSSKFLYDTGPSIWEQSNNSTYILTQQTGASSVCTLHLLTCTMLIPWTNQVHQQLDKSGTYVRVRFVDFSSAFNTIIPTLLQTKLTQLLVPSSICQWIPSFLTDRQR